MAGALGRRAGGRRTDRRGSVDAGVAPEGRLKGSAIGDFFGEWGREAGMYVLLGDSVLVLFAVLVAALVDRANARGQAYITLLGLFALCVAVHLNAPRRVDAVRRGPQTR